MIPVPYVPVTTQSELQEHFLSVALATVQPEIERAWTDLQAQRTELSLRLIDAHVSVLQTQAMRAKRL